MTQSFTITTATNNLAITAGEQKTISFTVANIGNQAVRGRVSLEPQGETPAGWFSLIGDAERDFVPAENEQFTYQIVIPETAAGGRFLFKVRIVNVDIDRIEEDVADSPVVSLDVKAQEKKKGFPWWIIAAIAAGVLFLIIVIVAVVLLLRRPEVNVTIADMPDPVNAGDLLGYTIEVANNGSSVAENLVFTDTLPAGVSLQSFDERCTPSEMGERVVCRAEELESDESLGYAIVVAVNGGQRAEIENQVALTTADTDEEDGPAQFTESTAVNVETALLLDVTTSAQTVTVGEAVNLTAVISNTGPSDATDIALSYPVPAGITLSNLPENCTATDSDLTCMVSNLGQVSAASISFDLTPGSGSIGSVTSEISVSSNESSPDPVAVTLEVLPATGLTLVVEQPEVSDEAFLINETIEILLRAANNAEISSGNATLTYQLPAGVNFDLSRADQVVGVRDCTRELAARTVTCLIGALNPGDMQQISLHLVPTTEGTTNHTFRIEEGVFGTVQASYAVSATPMDVCPAGCPFNNIQTAINAATAGDIIGIGAGTYPGNVTISKNIVLQGSRAGQTIVDGGNVQRGFRVETGATVTMNRLIIQNGRAQHEGLVLSGSPGAGGGGIINRGTLVLNYCLIRNNQAGPGIDGQDFFGFAGLGTPGGAGGNGGGIFNADTGVLTLNNSRVTNNRAGNGGNGGDSAFAFFGAAGGNGGYGGGVYTAGTFTNNNSTLEGNQVGQGGQGGTGSPNGVSGSPGQGPDFYNTRFIINPAITIPELELAPVVPFEPPDEDE